MSNERSIYYKVYDLSPKMNYNLFYHKLDAKYSHVEQFFHKKQYFLRKLQKTVLGSSFDHFLGKGVILHKKLI